MLVVELMAELEEQVLIASEDENSGVHAGTSRQRKDTLS
jgi:hypothetical protein